MGRLADSKIRQCVQLRDLYNYIIMASGMLTIPILPNNFENGTRHVRRRQDLYHVENHANLNIDSQGFQFQASAAAQIFPLLAVGDVIFTQPSSQLVSSPYILEDHLLDLSRLPNIQDRILSLALTRLAPTRTDYATASYEESFNWDDIRTTIGLLSDAARHQWRQKEYHVVIFRSKLRKDFDAPLLWDLDRESHREATESGGLLKYWFGSTDSDNRNLATCKSLIPTRVVLHSC